MLRIRTKRLCELIKKDTNSNFASTQGSYVHAVSAMEVNQSAQIRPALTPLSRYIPEGNKSFLVEDHRLSPSERTTQRVSSIIPWIVFGGFAITPFLVMKYNLQKLSTNQSASARVDSVAPVPARHRFGVFARQDIPELLARRTPTLVCHVSENYHSRVMSKLFEEIDSLFDKFGIKINVALIRCTSLDDESPAPYCEYFVPEKGDSNVYHYEGQWNVESLVRFVVPEPKISEAMRESIREIEQEVSRFHTQLFKARFIDSR